MTRLEIAVQLLAANGAAHRKPFLEPGSHTLEEVELAFDWAEEILACEARRKRLDVELEAQTRLNPFSVG